MSQKTLTCPLPMAFQLMAFFIRNPDEELTSNDVLQKFGTESADPSWIWSALRHYVETDYFVRVKRQEGSRSINVYSAGPRLERVGT